MAQVSSLVSPFFGSNDFLDTFTLIQDLQAQAAQLEHLQAELNRSQAELGQSQLRITQLEEQVARQNHYLDNFQYGQYFQCVGCQVGVDDFDERAVHICNCPAGVSLCRECFEQSHRSQSPLPRCQGCGLWLCDQCQLDHPDCCWDCLSRTQPYLQNTVPLASLMESAAAFEELSTESDEAMPSEWPALDMDDLRRMAELWIESSSSSDLSLL